MSFGVGILKEAVTHASRVEEYGAGTTVRIDEKAQQTAVVAGVFLAAGLGFLKPDSLKQLTEIGTLAADAILVLIVLLLVFCIGCCLWVVWVRSSPPSMAVHSLEELADDLLLATDNDPSESAQHNFYRDQLQVWKHVIDERAKLNRSKARSLLVAQSALAVNLLLVSLLLVLIIMSSLLTQI